MKIISTYDCAQCAYKDAFRRLPKEMGGLDECPQYKSQNTLKTFLYVFEWNLDKTHVGIVKAQNETDVLDEIRHHLNIRDLKPDQIVIKELESDALMLDDVLINGKIIEPKRTRKQGERMNKNLLTYIPTHFRKSIKDFYKDQDGYWLILDKNGEYILADDGHTIHEDTIKDILFVLKNETIKVS